VTESEPSFELIVIGASAGGVEAMDAGMTTLDPFPILLQHVVGRIVARERRRFLGAGLQISTNSPRGLPAVLGDDGAVSLVLSNLLSNAAKHGRQPGTVIIDLRHLDGDVEVRVLDDGPGLPAEEIPRLFRLYARGAGAPERASGAGIGLYVASRLTSGSRCPSARGTERREVRAGRAGHVRE
jgi:two-component system sensor histidine kinase KdpD